MAINLLHDGTAERDNIYSQIIYRIYQLFGEQRMIAQYFNVLLGMTSILYMLKTLERLKLHKKTIQTSVAFANFLPNFAIMNAIALRETPMITLIAVSLYCFVIWWQSGNKVNLIAAIVFVMTAATFHSGAIVPLLGYAVCILFYDRKENKFRVNKNTIIIAIVCFAVFNYLNNNYAKVFFGKFSGAESIEDVTEVKDARGGSGYNIGVSTGNATLDMVANTPIRLFYFIASPLPWQWRDLNDFIAFFFSAMFYLYCYYMAFKAITNKNCKNRDLIIIFLILAFVSGFIFAWGVSNAGTALRHRDKFVIQYLILLALCYENKKKRKVEYISGSGIDAKKFTKRKASIPD
jgi:4-amino-4-deoxy-L-arabinose transferase-like glycosyltransferase